ncbi:5-formyltetrahydrofolate cyclo-ligase family protein [Thalassovita autumnalis]|uniref:5-formyltetrahydrofolate cyclo-ligase n=1 Tax=Thalassovita autumnalis TaxID=2072972 RepID=A0A0P1FLW0_9RHOB|nr:5-formyltetrahydrofolate cyclo-ligase [Thalassovita autumnalis]CUH69075.1 5-formyltetrahydrofolate cyclo-ligase family protein [Thalassovita autumnalis]CUH73722.1 5-formyltetrahydrofolate cyclo-ligase family protein [Thalassovita autumnalis]
MNDLAEIKAQARKAAFARRKAAHQAGLVGRAGLLSEVLAGYRGVPLAGYMPIRTEISPLPAMEEASAHGPVGVPVIQGEAQPLKFSRWSPDGPLREGPFGAQVPEKDDYFDPEILIVPLVAFDRAGNRLGYGGGFYDRTLEGLRQRGGCLAIGFAYGAQEAAELPLEPTDQPLDMIVTEAEILSF